MSSASQYRAAPIHSRLAPPSWPLLWAAELKPLLAALTFRAAMDWLGGGGANTVSLGLKACACVAGGDGVLGKAGGGGGGSIDEGRLAAGDAIGGRAGASVRGFSAVHEPNDRSTSVPDSPPAEHVDHPEAVAGRPPPRPHPSLRLGHMMASAGEEEHQKARDGLERVARRIAATLCHERVEPRARGRRSYSLRWVAKGEAAERQMQSTRLNLLSVHAPFK